MATMNDFIFLQDAAKSLNLNQEVLASRVNVFYTLQSTSNE